MINLNELEDRWLKYKIKSYIPHIVILVSIAIIFTIFTLFYSKSTTHSKLPIKIKEESTLKVQEKTLPIPKTEKYSDLERKKEQVLTQRVPIVKKIEQKTLPIQPIQEKNIRNSSHEKTFLTPSLDFMSKLQDNTLPYFDNETDTAIEETLKEKSVQTKAIHKVAEKKQSLQIEPIKKQSSIQIDRQDTHDDIKQVIKRFKKNNNPALSLFIAKKYYQLGEYHQSYNYSLITNEINNDIEASWIIFAKSLVKLNEKSMAVETLKKYVKHSNSHRAKILLDEITLGKFR